MQRPPSGEDVVDADGAMPRTRSCRAGTGKAGAGGSGSRMQAGQPCMRWRGCSAGHDPGCTDSSAGGGQPERCQVAPAAAAVHELGIHAKGCRPPGSLVKLLSSALAVAPSSSGWASAHASRSSGSSTWGQGVDTAWIHTRRQAANHVSTARSQAAHYVQTAPHPYTAAPIHLPQVNGRPPL